MAYSRICHSEAVLCVRTPILADIYETHWCLLNIDSPVSNLHAMFSKHRLEMHGCDVWQTSPRNARMRCLANIASRCTHAMFSKHQLEVHSCDIYSASTPHETRCYLANIASSPFWNGISLSLDPGHGINLVLILASGYVHDIAPLKIDLCTRTKSCKIGTEEKG